MQKVKLFGSDGVFHAEGELNYSTIADYAILKRNERHYTFKSLSYGVAVYIEVGQPAIITEF